MICRHMEEASDEDIAKFDYYNDYRDTQNWLRWKIKTATSHYKKKEMILVYVKLWRTNRKYWENKNMRTYI